VVDETQQAFIEAGFYRIVQPRRYGGYELDYKVMLDIAAELGRGLAFHSPFKRGLRDVLAATSQNSMAWDVAAITYGQQRFGAVLHDPRLFPGR
jgi:hypothetical protein